MTDIEQTDALPPHDHPMLAILAGCAALVMAAVIGPRLAPQQPYATLLIGGAVLGAVLWALGFVVTIRRSALGWKLGSLAILAGAGTIAGLVAHGQYQTRARADASSFAEVEFGPQGAPQMPGDAAARGPISQSFVASVQADAKAQRDYAAALGAFGAGSLNSPYLLQQDPRAIGHCGDIERIKTLARDQSRQRADRQGAIETLIAEANLPAKTKSGIAMMASPGAPNGEDPVLANQQAMLDATGALCVLLARHGWYNAGGYFGFASPGDKARFETITTHRKAIAAQGAQIEHASSARMEQGRELVRDALSRSIFMPE